MTQLLTMTDEAKGQLRSVLDRQNKPEGALRVYVSPGGCSGFSYGMSLEDEIDPDDARPGRAGAATVRFRRDAHPLVVGDPAGRRQDEVVGTPVVGAQEARARPAFSADQPDLVAPARRQWRQIARHEHALTGGAVNP